MNLKLIPNLTPLEVRILNLFNRNKNLLLTRNQMQISIWSQKTHISDRTMDVHISNLRKKILPLGYQIDSVANQGYILSEINSQKEISSVSI